MLTPGEVLNAVRKARAHLELAHVAMRGIRAELEERFGLDDSEEGDYLQDLIDQTREIEETLMLGDDENG